MSDGTPFLRVAADRICAPGSARRWLSFERELQVERFRVRLNGLGEFHMENPGCDTVRRPHTDK